LSLTTRCPACLSLDVVPVQPIGWSCRNCGARFTTEGGQILVQPRSGRGRAWLIAAGVVTACLAAGLWALRDPEPVAPPAPAAATPTEVPPPAAVTAPVSNGPAQAELVDVRDASTNLGDRYWLMTYRNTGGSTIDRPGVVVKLFDAAGAVVKEETGSGPRDQIEPGGSIPMFVLIHEPPKHARAEVSVMPPVAATRPSWKVPLQAEGLGHKRQPLGATVVVGELVNPHGASARFIDVVVVGVDDGGRPVSWGSGIPSADTLPAGARAAFQVRMGTFEIEPPTRYQAYAVANVK
jgi:hypothetical protein